MSETYGLPVDVSAKHGGLRAIVHALNDGDIARAQMATLLLQMPEPPSLAKNSSSRYDMENLAALLECAGVLKINTRHFPAGSPDKKGGQFAPKDSNQQSGSDSTDSPNWLDRPDRDTSPSVTRAQEEAGEGAARAETDAVAESETRTIRQAVTRSEETSHCATG